MLGETAQIVVELQRRADRGAIHVGEAAADGARQRAHAPHQRRRIEDVDRPRAVREHEARGLAVAQQDREHLDVDPQHPQIAGGPRRHIVERCVQLAGLVRVDRLEPSLEAVHPLPRDVDGRVERRNLTAAPPLRSGRWSNGHHGDDRREERAPHPDAHASTAIEEGRF